jgi:hypothetical protein
MICDICDFSGGKTFIIEVDNEDEHDKIIEWCHHQFGNPSPVDSAERFQKRWFYEPYWYHFDVWFRHENDAILFKMRWG